MILQFGKHKGKSVAHVVLKEPDYAIWVLSNEEARGKLLGVRREIIRLVQIFDEEPILSPCRREGCGSLATRCSLYHGAVNPYWWCDTCDPTWDCPSPGKLSIVRTYLDAARYVGMHCGGRKADLAILVRELARARGLPDRAGRREVEAFFA